MAGSRSIIIFRRATHFRCLPVSRHTTASRKGSKRSSCPKDFHPRALPEPYVNLSIYTAPDVRPLPWHSGQWAKSAGFCAAQPIEPVPRAPLADDIARAGQHTPKTRNGRERRSRFARSMSLVPSTATMRADIRQFAFGPD